MATIITTLKTHTNQDTVYPNIRGENIPDNSISATKIQDGAVSNAKLATGAVTTDKILDHAVDQDKLAYSSVGTNELIDGSVTIDKMVDDSVGNDQIVDNAVGDSKIRKTGGVSLTTYEVQFGSWDAFLADLREKLKSPLTVFYYEYAVNSSTWYYIRPRSVWVCDHNTDPDDKGIEFVFDLPNGTTKTVTWTINSGEPDEVEYIYINFVY